MRTVITEDNIKDITELLKKNIGSNISDIIPELEKACKPKATFINQQIDLFIRQITSLRNFTLTLQEKDYIEEFLRHFIRTFSDKLLDNIYRRAYNDHCDTSVDAVEKAIKELGVNLNK